MSFLGEPFKHDLFVSYSHGDFDRSGGSNLKKWSQAFARELEGELRQNPEFRDLRLFLDLDHRPDQGLDPVQPLSRPLMEEIGASGILVVLMSPHYLESRWCGAERDWWVEWQKRQGFPIDRRIAVARIWPTEDPWPDPLVDKHDELLIGFTFYTDARPQPYEWPDPTGAKGRFRNELLEMVGRIWQQLRAFKEQLEERRRAPVSSSKCDVFLSYAREDAPRAVHLADELVNRGYSVFWDRKIPPGKSWRNHIVQALMAAKCVVVLWSDKSLISDYVLEEAEDGKDRGILIPALYDNVKPPIGFRSIQAADLTEWAIGKNSEPLQDLVDQIDELVRGSSVAR